MVLPADPSLFDSPASILRKAAAAVVTVQGDDVDAELRRLQQLRKELQTEQETMARLRTVVSQSAAELTLHTAEQERLKAELKKAEEERARKLEEERARKQAEEQERLRKEAEEQERVRKEAEERARKEAEDRIRKEIEEKRRQIAIEMQQIANERAEVAKGLAALERENLAIKQRMAAIKRANEEVAAALLG